MPLVFLAVGLILVAAALAGPNAPKQLLAQLKSDFVGSNNFTIWIVAIFAIGAIGYINGFRGVANLFLLLVVAVILLSNTGFFSQFSQALNQTKRTST
jgi:hypothetical protein